MLAVFDGCDGSTQVGATALWDALLQAVKAQAAALRSTPGAPTDRHHPATAGPLRPAVVFDAVVQGLLGPGSGSPRTGRFDALILAIERLPPGERRALLAVLVEGQRSADVATDSGVPATQVREAYARALVGLGHDVTTTDLPSAGARA